MICVESPLPNRSGIRPRGVRRERGAGEAVGNLSTTLPNAVDGDLAFYEVAAVGPALRVSSSDPPNRTKCATFIAMGMT